MNMYMISTIIFIHYCDVNVLIKEVVINKNFIKTFRYCGPLYRKHNTKYFPF